MTMADGLNPHLARDPAYCSDATDDEVSGIARGRDANQLERYLDRTIDGSTCIPRLLDATV